jgi:hypothetical protein
MLNTSYVGAKQMIATILGIGYGNTIVAKFRDNAIFPEEIYGKIVDLYSGIFGIGKLKLAENERRKFVEIWNAYDNLTDAQDIQDAKLYLEKFVNLFAFSEIAKVWEAIAVSMKQGLKWEELAKTPINVWYYSATAIGFTAPAISEEERVDKYDTRRG